MRQKAWLVFMIMLISLWVTEDSICWRGAGLAVKAVALAQPVASFQSDESPQLGAIGSPKPTGDTNVSEFRATKSAAQFQQIENGIPVSGVLPAGTANRCTWDLSRNQFFIPVPSGVSNLRFTLSGSPTGSDVDLAVRYNQPVDIFSGQLIRDFVSQSPGSFEEISIDFPAPGNWFVAVGNCELFSVSFALVASYGCSSILQLDDGGFENIVGYEGGASRAYFVNRVTPSSYPATLTSVLIYFPPRRESLPVGSSITILVGANPSGRSNIDGIFLRQMWSAIRFTGGFNEYPIEPMTIYSGDFVVGFVTSNPPGTYPAAYDTTFSRGRSYTSTGGFNFHRVEEFDTIPPGNFGIRARIRECRSLIFPGFNPQAVSGFVPRGGMVEYEFGPVSGASYRFSTCDGFASFNTVIEVFQNGRLLTQNDDGCISARSTVEATLFDSARVVVRVRGSSSSSTGNFTMIFRRIF